MAWHPTTHWIGPAPDTEHGTVGALLRTQAREIGDSPFLLANDERRTYAEVDAISNSYARGLQERGVGRGDAVCVFMENSIEFAYVTFAVNKLGAFWVPLDPAYKLESLASGINRSTAKVLVVDHELWSRVEAVGDQLDLAHVIVRGSADGVKMSHASVSELASLGANATGDIGVDVDYRDTCAVLWTSGTTGMPKGVIQRHFTWLYNAAALSKAKDLRDDDVFLNVLPMHHSTPWLQNLYAALQSGLSTGLDERFSVSGFWDRVRHYGATQIISIGALHMHLWLAPQRPNDIDNPARIAMMVPMPPDIDGPFRERFGIEQILQLSGQSEVLCWSYADARRPRWKEGSSGLAREDLELAILDDDDVEVPANAVGEVCIRPKVPYMLFGGYFNDAEATLKVFRNLWYHSGDLGRVDEDGEFFFVDRKADFMRYKGRNISSMEVENYIRQHPAVELVAVHGVRAEELESEDEVKACIVLRDGETATADEIAVFINERAPYYMVPRYIEFYDEVPQTPTGRIKKHLLREKPITENTWDAKAVGFVASRD